MHNLILSTAIGKVKVAKNADGWELTTWERPIGLSWKSMRRLSVEQFAPNDFAGAKYQAHYYYRDLLADTIKWSNEEYQK